MAGVVVEVEVVGEVTGEVVLVTVVLEMVREEGEGMGIVVGCQGDSVRVMKTLVLVLVVNAERC